MKELLSLAKESLADRLPSPMKISPAVSALFQQLVDTIEAEVRADFMGRLGAAPAPTRGKPGPKPRAAASTPAPSKGGRRSADDLEALKKTILGAIKKAPGSRVEELASSLGLSTKDMALPMLQLRDEKLIAKKGEKRAARYTAK